MYFHLLLFCLHFYFGISAHLSSQPFHAERRWIHPVQLGTLEHPKNVLYSAGHRSKPRSSNSNVDKVQRPMLVARAGGGAAVLDKQFNKKITKATARWEKSVNGKALTILFHKILALPSVEVTQGLFAMAGDTQRDIFVNQLAALESLLRIINQKFSFDKSKIVISSNEFEEHDEGILQRRGYTVLDRSEAQRKTHYITSTTFVFNTIPSPHGVAQTVGLPGTYPSIYLGISPRFTIEDTIKQPEVYGSTFTMAPGICKTIREVYLRPFVKGRPFQDLVVDPGYKDMRPPMAVFWNTRKVSQFAPAEVAKAPVAENEAKGSEKPLPDKQGHEKDEGSSAGPSSQAPPSKADQQS